MAPERRQTDARPYIRPLGNARCATPATQKGGDQMTPVRRQRDARAYIRPLANARCATPATPEGRQRDAIRPLGNAHYQCTLCHACHAKAAETKGHQRRRPNGTRGTPEGRQGVHPTPWQCTLRHACHARAAETKWHQRDARGTPGRTPEPLPMHVVPRLPRKGGNQMAPEGGQDPETTVITFLQGSLFSGSNFPHRRMPSSFPACFLHASDIAASGDSESK